MPVTIAGTTGTTQPTATCTTNLVLTGSSSGTTTVQAAATASGTITVPAGTGTVAVNGVSSSIVLGTSQATTSGTSIDFTSIPSWVNRIDVVLTGVSTSGTSSLLLQIGPSAAVETSGYAGVSVRFNNPTTTSATMSAGYFVMGSDLGLAANTVNGTISITRLDTTTFIFSGMATTPSNTTGAFATCTKTVTGTMSRVRLTTVNGTDTFDAGSVNIQYS